MCFVWPVGVDPRCQIKPPSACISLAFVSFALSLFPVFATLYPRRPFLQRRPFFFFSSALFFLNRRATQSVPSQAPQSLAIIIMPDPQISPISQLLHTLGITKEDLEKRSNQMRQFLTAEDANSLRVADLDSAHGSSSTSDLLSISQSTSSTSSISRSRSRTNSYSYRDSTPPMTPIKSESTEGPVPQRQFDSMEMVIERQRRQSRKEKKERRERECYADRGPRNRS